MTTEFMRDLLASREKITIEYKECQNGIYNDVYETICSFSNRYGGYIIMGVRDDGTPELFEDDVFKISIPLNVKATNETKERNTLSEREKAIFNMITKNKSLTVEEVMEEFSISRATVFRDYAKIRKITGAVYNKRTGEWSY